MPSSTYNVIVIVEEQHDIKQLVATCDTMWIAYDELRAYMSLRPAESPVIYWAIERDDVVLDDSRRVGAVRLV
jgi:hypothetical protein